MMKHFLVFISVIFSLGKINSQTVSVNDAHKYVDQNITVCAKVVETHVSKGESKVIYLNLDKPYPNNPFTIVIFEKSADNFSYNPLEFLKNKNICVTGKVTLYKNKPQIIANTQDQIKIQK